MIPMLSQAVWRAPTTVGLWCKNHWVLRGKTATCQASMIKFYVSSVVVDSQPFFFSSTMLLQPEPLRPTNSDSLPLQLAMINKALLKYWTNNVSALNTRYHNISILAHVHKQMFQKWCCWSEGHPMQSNFGEGLHDLVKLVTLVSPSSVMNGTMTLHHIDLMSSCLCFLTRVGVTYWLHSPSLDWFLFLFQWDAIKSQLHD